MRLLSPLPFFNKVHVLSHLFLFLNLTIALLGMRLPDILNLPMLRFFIYFLFALGFLVSLVSCLKLKPVLTIGLCLFSGSIFFHAFVIFFLPSFRPGIAFQNYVLQNTFSSYFAISQTRLYMMYPVLFLFPVLSLYLEGFTSNYKHYYARKLILIFLSCMFINNIVVFIQGLWDIHFLAQGSMTSIDANRTPGLFLDSGESGVMYSLMTAL
ncbi:MAG: hypothetical protein V4591_09115, partial [Bdellovibrionota bacterium]